MSVDLRELHGLANALLSTMTEWRRTFHQWPELGFEEVKTSAKIAEILKEYELDVTRQVAKTGVVGLLRGARPGPTVAIRADMDALPIYEETGLPFASKVDGLMHACGHDGHMAAALGACAILASLRDEFSGSVKFIFQPAEEMLGGGYAMCEEGVLEGVHSIYGLHLWPALEKGKVAILDGTMMAAFDEFTIEISGKPSHGAAPHLGVDSIVVAARVVEALQHVVARTVDPQEPSVLTIGKVQGGSATNIIADRTWLAGSVRSFTSDVREALPREIERILRGVCEAHGADYRLTWSDGYPALVNEPDAVARYQDAVGKVLGSEAVARGLKPSMASEDFAYYLERISGAYAFVGIGEAGGSPGLHTPQFRFDETVLADAAAVLAGVALKVLHGSELEESA